MNAQLETFENYESEVRSYIRSFPALFVKAKGEFIYDKNGRKYIDFLSAAGSLNYGHNHPDLKRKLIEYIESDGIAQGLDMATEAKKRFIETFDDYILKPRKMKYKMQFTGPTGTNAVEAALKLARKVTKRSQLIAFFNGFHGMSMGSLSVTGNLFARKGAGIPLNGVTFMPYNTVELLEKAFENKGSGIEKPAAIILETIQGEGGVNVAEKAWLQKIAEICRINKILLIVDDIQVGCGRTGSFFSFEEMGIQPDIIILSKSLSGYGMPMSLVLLKPELDIWSPGEHNGTFRGNNLAFVTAREALNLYWKDDSFTKMVDAKSKLLKNRLERIKGYYPDMKINIRGRGLIYGISFDIQGIAKDITRTCFNNGLIIETCGPDSSVIKCIPPLIIDTASLEKGLDILEESVYSEMQKYDREALVAKC
ncbi:MAG TPA: diaminobutyrate--2-oxoglutarate transaminase [Clostridia bacterium]